ncbi:hypothetical protein SEA_SCOOBYDOOBYDOO_13 [Mycobacterium phage ScoobyDoobyDoo]|nr:hypothetical protein SEA_SCOOBYDOOBYDOO_13 [Mycobacterium phage ScoobyDoobyDoo]
MSKRESYTNRQGNLVTVHRNEDGSVATVTVIGTGSRRAFAAQSRAACKRAESATR